MWRCDGVTQAMPASLNKAGAGPSSGETRQSQQVISLITTKMSNFSFVDVDCLLGPGGPWKKHYQKECKSVSNLVSPQGPFIGKIPCSNVQKLDESMRK